MAKVSVIVPVYNSEKYLKKCIQSLCQQTLKDIELIFVNDGSSDQSYDILKTYAEKDNRIKVISLDYNKGASYARNVGLDIATGDYIQFVDSDDYLEADSLEKLYKQSSVYSAEMCYLHMNFVVDQIYQDSYIQCGVEGKYSDIYSGEEILKIFIQKKEFFLYLCSVFYNRRFIEENKLRFKEITIGEGGNFILRALVRAKRVMVCNDNLYNYRIHAESITHVADAKRRLIYGEFIQYVDMLQIFGNNIFSGSIRVFLEQKYKKVVAGIQVLSEKEFDEISDKLNSEFERYQLNLMRGNNVIYDIKITPELISRMRDSKYVIIYGAGYAARDFINIVDKYQIEILGLAVNSLKNNPKNIYGHHVFEIKELEKYREEAFVVVTANQIYNKEIEKTLNEYGFWNVEFLNIEI